jgi:hypothetical protein
MTTRPKVIQHALGRPPYYADELVNGVPVLRSLEQGAPLPIVTEVPCFTGDGSASHVTCGEFPLPSTEDFSFEFDYFHDGTLFSSILDIRTSTHFLFAWATNTSAVGSSKFYLNGSVVAEKANTLSQGKWHHVVLSRAGNSFTQSVTNIETQNTVSETHTHTGVLSFAPNARLGLMGTYWNGTSFLTANPPFGRIANFKFTSSSHNREYTFQECGGRTIYDTSGNGNHGTIVGGDLANIWANKVTSKDHCVEHGGRWNWQ